MAAYTGQQVTWDQALNSQEKLVPDKLDWNGKLEVRPRARAGHHEVRLGMRTVTRMALAAGLVLAAASLRRTAGREARERADVQRIHDRIAGAAGAAQGGRRTRSRFRTRRSPTTWCRFRPASSPWGRTRKKDEQPPHKVRLDAFWMQAHEVTWDEYRLFMFANQGGETAHKDEVVDAVSRPTRPYVEMSFGMGINGFPAISMTQHAANKYAEWLSARTGEFYRLPTEAEWEYACRAGATGDAGEARATYAWYAANSKGKYQRSPPRSRTPGASTTCSATSWSGRSISMRRTRPAPQVEPMGEGDAAVSARGARRVLERSRRTR